MKIGYRFQAVPRDRHPRWFDVSWEARSLGLELYVSIRDDKTGIACVAVSDNWATSVCKLLRIEASQRQAACRCLESLERHGLLVVRDGTVRVVFRADEELGPTSPDPRKVKPPSDQGQEGVKLTSSNGQADVKPLASRRNDSTHVLQIEEIEERERRAGAGTRETQTESALEPEPEAPESWVRLARHYATLHDELEEGRRDARPAYDLQSVHRHYRSFAALLERSRKHSRLTGLPVPEVFEHAARRFLADPQQRAKGHVLAFFERDFARWCDGLQAVAS